MQLPSKEKAREILLDYFHSKYSMPIYDERITYIRPKTWSEVTCEFDYDPYEGMVKEEYTFRELIKYAYNLKEDEVTK